MSEMLCKYCRTKIEGNYCPHCNKKLKSSEVIMTRWFNGPYDVKNEHKLHKKQGI